MDVDLVKSRSLALPGCVRFPGVAFDGQAAFDAFCSESQALLDARFVYEQALAVCDGSVVREGSCASCVRVAHFLTQAGDWRDGQVCNCADRLGHRARAMLHFLQTCAGLDEQSALAFIGPPGPLEHRLAGQVSPPVILPRLLLSVEAGGDAVYRLDAPDGAFGIAICWDYLQRIPPLEEALLEIRRVLVSGGWFVFSLPFHYLAAETISRLGHVPRRAGRLPAEFRGEINEIGWDILDKLRAAGFSQAQVHHYWSDELGYLGAFNLLLSARV